MVAIEDLAKFYSIDEFALKRLIKSTKFQQQWPMPAAIDRDIIVTAFAHFMITNVGNNEFETSNFAPINLSDFKRTLQSSPVRKSFKKNPNYEDLQRIFGNFKRICTVELPPRDGVRCDVVRLFTFNISFAFLRIGDAPRQTVNLFIYNELEAGDQTAINEIKAQCGPNIDQTFLVSYETAYL